MTPPNPPTLDLEALEKLQRWRCTVLEAALPELKRANDELEALGLEYDRLERIQEETARDLERLKAEAAATEDRWARNCVGFQEREDRLTELMNGEPESKHPAPFEGRLVSYVERLRTELHAARERIGELEHDNARLTEAIRPFGHAAMKADWVNTFPQNYLHRANWNAAEDEACNADATTIRDNSERRLRKTLEWLRERSAMMGATHFVERIDAALSPTPEAAEEEHEKHNE